MPTLPSLRNLPSLAIDLDSTGGLELSALSDSLKDDLISPNELTTTVDSAYVSARVNRSLFLDSIEAIALIDSSYVQARQNFISEADIQAIIDSAHIDSVIGYKYLDSIEAVALTNPLYLDSIQAVTLTNPLYMDSIEVTNLVDSSYVQRRVNFDGYATEVYVDSNITVAVSALVNGADQSFDTLKEIQDAMATDTELSDAINNLIIPSKTSDLTNDGDSIASNPFITLPYEVSNFINDANYLDSTTVQNINVSALINDANYLDSVRARNVIEGEDLNLGSNKILFSNVYYSESELPSASSYHGMFAHVHSTGLGYFAHAGQWIQLADENTNVSTFTNDANYLDSAKVEAAEYSNINTDQITLGDWTISVDANGDLNFTHSARGISMKLEQSTDKLIAKGDITAFGDL